MSSPWGSRGLVSGTFVNQGTISADTPGGNITLIGTNWSNSGTIQTTPGGGIIQLGVSHPEMPVTLAA